MRTRILIGSILFVGILSGCGGGKSSKEEKLAKLKAKNDSLNEVALLEKAKGFFQPIPEVVENPENPVTPAKVKLGHYLYFDKNLSRKKTMSCNSCHNLETFGVDNLPTSPGEEGKNGERNSPTVLNAALQFAQFWDGRAKDVEEQAGMPILNPVEMNIPSKEFLIDRLSKIEKYQKMFKEAFPDDNQPLTYKNLQKAIGAFERTLTTPSRFDKYLKGDFTALSKEEKEGLKLFIDGGCVTCHAGANLGGTMFQKFGVYGNYWDYTKSEKIDEGKAAVTGEEFDKYFFKVPILRNVTKTYPYFHDGSVEKLGDAVKIMAKTELNKDLTEEQVQKIVSFLTALEGDLPEEKKKAPSDLPV